MSYPQFNRSIGGLVTGLESYLKTVVNGKDLFTDYLWVGWPGSEIKLENQETLEVGWRSRYKYIPVFLSQQLIEGYYRQYCNQTLWPLFHSFAENVQSLTGSWESYKKANEEFCTKLEGVLQKDDVIWIHDFQLLLLPGLIRDRFPEATISFFLHVPFPSPESFSILPDEQQEALVQSLLKSDLVGFHTDQYLTSFNQCLSLIKERRISLKKPLLKHNNGVFGVFPMGIDYDAFRSLAREDSCIKERKKTKEIFSGKKIIFSVDRLDYTKGILHKLAAYERFLSRNPEWSGNVILLLVVAPCRREINSYKDIKKSIDEYVGRINGNYSTHSWAPIQYVYKQYELPELAALYGACSVKIVSPLRDGMNLIAKEYIASQTGFKGTLLLSENAGAIHELSGAVKIDPLDTEGFADSIRHALEMPVSEQRQRNKPMHRILKKNSVKRWAERILEHSIKSKWKASLSRAEYLNLAATQAIIHSHKLSSASLFLLDYDGTLSPLKKEPWMARPTENLINLLKKIADNEKNQIVIITGRDKETVAGWFENYKICFSADMGAWIGNNGVWTLLTTTEIKGKHQLKKILDVHAAALPGSNVEEKQCALVWDYRGLDEEMIQKHTHALTLELSKKSHLLSGLDILHGKHSLIIRDKGINKGKAASYWLNRLKYDFVLAIGDDDPDEEMFDVLPPGAFSIRVGNDQTSARFYTSQQANIISLLEKF